MYQIFFYLFERKHLITVRLIGRTSKKSSLNRFNSLEFLEVSVLLDFSDDNSSFVFGVISDVFLHVEIA